MGSSYINGIRNPSTAGTYTDGYAECTMGIPLGRPTASGHRPIIITSIGLWLGGRGASRTLNVQVGGAQTGNFAIAATSSAGYMALGIYGGFVNGGSAPLRINMSGSSWFGRAALAGVSVATPAQTWASNTIVGDFNFAEVCAPPTMLSATPGPGGKITTVFTGSGDTGGLGPTGYILEWSTDAFATVNSRVNSTGSDTYTFTPGQTIWFRAATRNAVSDQVSSWSQYSNVIAATAKAGGEAWNGTAWVPAIGEAWNGNAWVGADSEVFAADGTWHVTI